MMKEKYIECMKCKMKVFQVMYVQLYKNLLIVKDKYCNRVIYRIKNVYVKLRGRNVYVNVIVKDKKEKEKMQD